MIGCPCSRRDSQESSPAPQFKRINSSALSLHYGPTLTSVCDSWKYHSLDCMNFAGNVISLLYCQSFIGSSIWGAGQEGLWAGMEGMTGWEPAWVRVRIQQECGARAAVCPSASLGPPPPVLPPQCPSSTICFPPTSLWHAPLELGGAGRWGTLWPWLVRARQRRAWDLDAPRRRRENRCVVMSFLPQQTWRNRLSALNNSFVCQSCSQGEWGLASSSTFWAGRVPAGRPSTKWVASRCAEHPQISFLGSAAFWI